MVQHSPRKLRLIADAVRPLPPLRAVDYLRTMPQRGAKTMLKVYLQGLGNAKNNFRLSPADMQTETLLVEEGARGPKKADVHSHGARFNRGIRRRKYSHVTLILAPKPTASSETAAVEPEVISQPKN